MNGSNNGSLLVRTRPQVAELFGVSVTAVGNWKQESWWNEEEMMRGGWYYLPAIVQAYMANRGKGPNEQARAIKLAQEAQQLEKLRLENARRKRAEDRELRNTLPADVYREFLREFLGMVRESYTTLGWDASREVPEEVRGWFYDEAGPTLVDRLVEKRIERITRWLQTGEAEIDQTEEAS